MNLGCGGLINAVNKKALIISRFWYYLVMGSALSILFNPIY